MDIISIGITIVLTLGLIRIFLSDSQPPQIVYVQAEPVEQSGGGGCLPGAMIVAVIIGVLLVVSSA